MSRALVISGGGSKGAFAVGVLKRLQTEFPELGFDIFVGTSTGSLITPMVAVEELYFLETIFTTKHTEDIVHIKNLGERLKQDAIFDDTPLQQLIVDNYSNDRYKKILDSGKKLFFTSVCLQTGELVVFTTDPNPAQSKYYKVQTLKNADHFRAAIMASASQPVFMHPIHVNAAEPGAANAHYQFVDGGVREYAGIQMAIDAGATEIFTILLSSGAADDDSVEFGTIFPILQRLIDIFIDDVGKNDLIIPQQYNDALHYIDAVKKKMESDGISPAKLNEYFHIAGLENPFEGKVPLKLYTIRPDAPLGGGPGGLTFDPAIQSAMVQKGKAAGEEFIAGLNPGEITWA